MIDPFICEQKNGCITYSKDLLSAREKGIEALAVVKTTGNEKGDTVKMATFATKPLSMALKTKQMYMRKRGQLLEVYILCKT